jgi:hypothetical protein
MICREMSREVRALRYRPSRQYGFAPAARPRVSFGATPLASLQSAISANEIKIPRQPSPPTPTFRRADIHASDVFLINVVQRATSLPAKTPSAESAASSHARRLPEPQRHKAVRRLPRRCRLPETPAARTSFP